MKYGPIEVSVQEARKRASPDRPLIDIRSDREREQGIPAGALVIDTESLLRQSSGTPGLALKGAYLLCGKGMRSRNAAEALRAEGLGDFVSVAGGFRAWSDAGLPVDYPEGLDAAQAERYARHLVMPQVGARGQRKLLASRVLLVGLGGLNSPVALYLAAAGVGTLGLADHDRVERSNLQRQVIHGESGLGTRKITSSQARIADLNPEVETVLFDQRVDSDNARELVRDWDVVVDGTDNFASRYALNDACLLHGKPLIYGAVMRFQGQVSVFWPASGPASSPCFRCLAPREPEPGEAPSCAEAGVLGVLPGLVGMLQANEALKLILGIGTPLLGRLLLIDALHMEFREARVLKNPACISCGQG